MMDNNRRTRMSFRANADEQCEIAKDAELAGMSKSTYMRSRLLNAPQTAPTYRRTETKLLIKHLIGQIGRVSNNMNQIAFKLNSNRILTPIDGEKHAEGIRALTSMRSLLITHMLQNNGPC